MYIVTTYPTCYLVQPEDLETGSPLPELPGNDLQALRKIVAWAHEFLCQPHPDLGRDGAVCPFVRTSLDKELFWLTVQSGQHLTVEHLCTIVRRYRDWFCELPPRSGLDARYKTLLILFPDMEEKKAIATINEAQKVLKPDFVAKQLMIGQFYSDAADNGIWNPQFRPLRAPVPLLAIRHIVTNDFPFLKHDRQFLSVYLQVCSGRIPERFKQEVEVAIQHFGLAAYLNSDPCQEQK